jgi:hypothetical protein
MHELDIHLPLDPVALTTPPAARAAIAPLVAGQVAGLPFLLASSVTLRVTCPTRPVRAPGLVEYPHLAAWVGALTDALTGARRLLLSAWQVTRVDVVTAPPDAATALLVSVVSSPPQRRLDKAGLRFVIFPGGWCAPVPSSYGPSQAQAAVRRLSETLAAAARRAPDPLGRGFVRASELAPDIPVVPAERLLGLSTPVGRQTPRRGGAGKVTPSAAWRPHF